MAAGNTGSLGLFSVNDLPSGAKLRLKGRGTAAQTPSDTRLTNMAHGKYIRTVTGTNDLGPFRVRF